MSDMSSSPSQKSHEGETVKNPNTDDQENPERSLGDGQWPPSSSHDDQHMSNWLTGLVKMLEAAADGERQDPKAQEEAILKCCRSESAEAPSIAKKRKHSVCLAECEATTIDRVRWAQEGKEKVTPVGGRVQMLESSFRTVLAPERYVPLEMIGSFASPIDYVEIAKPWYAEDGVGLGWDVLLYFFGVQLGDNSLHFAILSDTLNPGRTEIYLVTATAWCHLDLKVWRETMWPILDYWKIESDVLLEEDDQYGALARMSVGGSTFTDVQEVDDESDDEDDDEGYEDIVFSKADHQNVAELTALLVKERRAIERILVEKEREISMLRERVDRLQAKSSS